MSPLLGVLLLCNSLHLQLCTATGRLSSVVSFIALVDALMELFDINAVQFANPRSHLKHISGVSWCDSNTRLSASLCGGVCIIVDDAEAAWPNDLKQQETVERYELAAVKVVVPGITMDHRSENAQRIVAAVRVFLASSHHGWFLASRCVRTVKAVCLEHLLLAWR